MMACLPSEHTVTFKYFYNIRLYMVYSNDDLIAILRQWTSELGRVPHEREIKRPSAFTFWKHFGSWNKALTAAGLDINISYTPIRSDDECVICSSKDVYTHDSLGRILCLKCWHHEYRHTEKGAAVSKRHRQKQRGYGFNPLNDKLNDTDHFHHLHLDDDHSIGLYIPVELHNSISHSSTTWIGMDDINAAAIRYWIETILLP